MNRSERLLRLLPGQVISHSQLLEEGFSKVEVAAMSASLKIFPTPFKGVYYVPMPEERKGCFIDKPLRVLSMAMGLFLEGGEFYYSCETAEEALGIRWRPSGRVHVVNEKISGRVNLKERIMRNLGKGTYRAKKIARLLSFYGNEIVFHRTRSMERNKVKHSPYGSFAVKSQIRKDRKKFGEK
jgi:hypothetical protein